MQQKFDEAIVQYRAALDASDSNPSVLNNLGLALAIKEDYPRAIKSLERARSRTDQMNEEDAKRIGLNLARVYGLSGDMEKAESTARPFVTGAELYNNLGHYAVMAKNKELARTYLNMALTNSKEHYERAWENLKELQ
jgi:Flp pilus assembly protein TadD